MELGGFLIWKMCVSLIFGTWIIKATSEQGSRGNDVNLQRLHSKKKREEYKEENVEKDMTQTSLLSSKS